MQLQGISVSEGIALGKARFFRTEGHKPNTEIIPDGEQRQEEFRKFISVRKEASAQLDSLKESTGKEEKEIFTAQNEILFDPDMEAEIKKKIEDNGFHADHAVDSVCETYAEKMEKLEDPLFSERSADIRDIKKRLLNIILGDHGPDLKHLSGNVILIAQDLQPSDTAELDRRHILAVVTEKGGETSHTAIIARKNGLPALAGVRDVFTAIRPDSLLIVDAVKGILIGDPDEDTIRKYRKKAEEFQNRKKETEEYLWKKSELKDGTRVEICLNIASAEPEELAQADCSDGAGLLRTEYFYMNRDKLPDEELQFNAYCTILKAFAGKRVVLRTLDIGGDKQTDCLKFPPEDNPFLGLRAIRYCFEREDVFRVQLRAVLRASAYGNLAVMFPMISSLEEIRTAKEILGEEKKELIRKKIPVGDLPAGIMIETPSIALQADDAAEEVDFASIGTNDLCQYLLAVDRQNPRVSGYYRKYHPAVFRMISRVADAFSTAGKPLSVCGELGGDVLAAPVLVGMGIRRLSMNISSVAGIKKTLSALTKEECCRMAEKVLEKKTASEIEEVMRNR